MIVFFLKKKTKIKNKKKAFIQQDVALPAGGSQHQLVKQQ